jgi:putative transcriptional regulator
VGVSAPRERAIIEPMASESLAGHLLVATPVIGDPNFHRSVVLLLDHGEDGTIGVVINRPTDVALRESMPGWETIAAVPGVVFVGGPVEQAGAIGLGRLAPEVGPDGGLGLDDDAAWSPVLGMLGPVGPLATVDLTSEPGAMQGIEALRVFVGYAGWAPGQLEAELAQEAWIVADAQPADLWSPDPEGLWARVLRRQGSPTAWLALHPVDPSTN